MHTRRTFLKAAASLPLLGLLPRRAEAEETDAITNCTRETLADWVAWLDREGERGYVGELGWPNDEDGYRPDIDQWNALGERVYSWMDQANLWATYWAASHSAGPSLGGPGSIWHAYSPTDQNYAAFGYGGRTLGEAQEQASVIEAHRCYKVGPRNLVRRGVNLADGYHAWNRDFSNENPGVCGSDYRYAGYDSLKYLRSRGVGLLRMCFLWERIQPEPFGPLNAAETARVHREIDYASSLGQWVVLDPHNMGRYKFADGHEHIGSERLPVAAFADLWGRLSAAFRDRKHIAGYDLMNEPGLYADLPGGVATWERASQVAVDAIRANGDEKRVIVPGYHRGGGMHKFLEHHPKAWIRDPANNKRYTTHLYFGRNLYAESYDETNAFWAQRGY